MDIKQIVEESKTLKEALEKQGLAPSCYQRNKLKQQIESNGWKLYSNPQRDQPLSTHGVWATITANDLQKIVKSCECWTQVLRTLGITERGSTYITAHKYVNLFKIDISHFKGKAVKGAYKERSNIRSNEELFVENSTATTSTVRKRVLDQQLIKYVCSVCGQLPIHNNKPLTLQIEHINGDCRDHRIQNLTFLCPNCHTQTGTWGQKKRMEP